MAFHKGIQSFDCIGNFLVSQMSNEAKKRHLNKVLCCNPSASTPDNSNQASLSISIEESGITSISKATLENMWKKAGEIVKSGESILSVPWNSDKKYRLVKNYSSTQPHMVTVNSRNRSMYVCDESVTSHV